MSKRENIKTTIQEIVDYWSEHEDECGLSVDWSEAHERCWRCGCKRGLQRCHIVPYSLGGEDTPSNLVLLCGRCHLDNPNVADPEVMWDWIRAYGVSLYDTFWSIHGMIEYEKIYGSSIYEEFAKRNLTTKEDLLEFKEISSVMFGRASWHFGDPHFNVATIAGVYRMTFKEYDKRHGRKTERDIKKWILTKNLF